MDKILLTGSSGFLGQIIKNSLTGCKIISLGRKKGDIICDLSKNIPVLPACDIIIHAAGKAHSVPSSELEKNEFFDANVQGTINLLKGISSSVLPSALVFISSVAVYGRTNETLIDENEPLVANDPYGRSKIVAERVITKWCEENNVVCVVLRLPLLAGPNPPGNLKSMIEGIRKGYYFNIGGGKAKKSMVLVEDIVKIIPKATKVGGVYNLTDGCHPSFNEIANLIATQLNKNKPASIPKWVAKGIAMIGDIWGAKAPLNSDKLSKITSDLTFDDSKARKLLHWNPNPVLEKFKIY